MFFIALISLLLSTQCSPSKEISKCYECSDYNCTQLNVQICRDKIPDGPVACFHSEVKNETGSFTSRGCVTSTLKDDFDCLITNDINSEVTCSYCYHDLCNVPEKTPQDLPGVEECYFCVEDCTLPLKIQYCNADDSYGDYVCVSIKIPMGGYEYYARECEARNTSEKFCSNISSQGGECSLCDSNLCNTVQSAVKQCYFCESPCDKPPQIRNCSEVLDDDTDAGCLYVDAIDQDGLPLKQMMCVHNDITNNEDCDEIVEEGYKCSICNTNLCNKEPDEDDDNGETDNQDPDDNSALSISCYSVLMLIPPYLVFR